MQNLSYDLSELNKNNTNRISTFGHRYYVGGTDSETWYTLGKRQYHFLISQGLEPHHNFLDVACGSLRLGQFLIPMLNIGCYYGLEAEKTLVSEGIKHEFLFDIIEKKSPKFSYGYNFDVSFCPYYDYAIAQSLFTHLNEIDISLCFKQLNKISKKDSKFYFTFFEGDDNRNHKEESHPNKVWYYSFDKLEKIASENNFNLKYIGDWGHERGQMMGYATPCLY